MSNPLRLGGRFDQAMPQRAETEIERAAHLDVSERDGRDARQRRRTARAAASISEALHSRRVPGHNDIGQQGRRAGDRRQILARRPCLARIGPLWIARCS
jgi:hypothetical protein